MNIFKDKNNVPDEARLRLFIVKAALELPLRVNHQVETWLENDLQPTDLGWKLVAVTTQLPAAPVRSLKSSIAIVKVAANTTNVGF